jgi:hypothetical protein
MITESRGHPITSKIIEQLLSDAARPTLQTGINVGTIRGIEIKILPELDGKRPILCKKGDVFPLAGEYYD